MTPGTDGNRFTKSSPAGSPTDPQMPRSRKGDVGPGGKVSQPVKIGLAVITKNEARNIGRCLESCAGLVSDIVVVDSGSTDATVAVAQSLGARVLTHTFDNYGAQKNRALDAVDGEWILNLDADEWLSDALRDSIRAAVESARPDCVAFGFPRHNIVCGFHTLRGGWRERNKVRLFRRGHAHWVGTVHEWLETDNGMRCGRIRAPLLHDMGDDWDGYVAKQFRYAELHAVQMFETGHRAGRFSAVSHAAVAYLRAALFQGAVLDGAFGLRTAQLRAQVAHAKWTAIRRQAFPESR
jgi:glycosyltransferase involved in cell wall biosynthesis